MTLVVIDLRIICTFFCTVRHGPTYQRVRSTLILSVSPIVVDISPDILNIRNNRHAQALVNIFLTGDPRLSTEINKEICHMFWNTLLQPNDSDDDKFGFVLLNI